MAKAPKNKARKNKPTKQKVASPLAVFWNRPPLMNFAADALFVFAIAALALATLLGAQRLPVFPLRQLVVVGAVNQVTPMQVEYAARNSVGGNFFTINLDAVRSAFEKLPWVRRADVRRIWPDGIEVRIEEQKAVARWRQADGEYRLVNGFGEVFIAASEADLPIFAGPEGMAEQILQRQQEFTQKLAAIGKQPRELTLSARQAWTVKLEDGLLVVLGRDETQHPVSDRMARFVAAYPELEQKFQLPPGMIDMRYPNGFAVRAALRREASTPMKKQPPLASLAAPHGGTVLPWGGPAEGLA